MGLDKNSHQPLYRQLMEELRTLIQTGYYKNGDKIPTEPQLSNLYNVSRITVRRTVEELCKQGLVVKRQGKGTFVQTPKLQKKIEQKPNMSFTEVCILDGIKPTSQVITTSIIEAEEWQKDYLKLQEGETILSIERILSANNVPIIYETLYLPAKRFSNFPIKKLRNTSLFQILKEEYDIIDSSNNKTTIEIDVATQEMANQLCILVGEPVMLLTSYMRDKSDKPAYIGYKVAVGSRYTFSV